MAATMTSQMHKMYQKPDYSDYMPDWMSSEASTGTTIMGAEYDGGVIIGADSRSTTGAYVANRVTNKVNRITDRVYCCNSGSSADTQAISRIVKYHLAFHEIELGQPTQVKVAANVFRELCYNYRDQLMAGFIIAGWDKREGGQLYSIPLGGMCVRQPICIGGSGSTYIYGYVDSHFKPKMTKEECKEFVAKGLALAMSRDGSSGGVINLMDINEHSATRETLHGDKIPKVYEG